LWYDFFTLVVFILRKSTIFDLEVSFMKSKRNKCNLVPYLRGSFGVWTKIFYLFRHRISYAACCLS